jgi:hypothetical protein
MLSKRERSLRTARFQETDRVPVYDILQNDALIAHYAGEAITPENGYRVKGLAIGRTLDMTRMPEGPAQPEERRAEDGFIIHAERWTSWIIARPFTDTPGMLEWVKDEIQRAEQREYGLVYREHFYRWMDDCAAYSAAGDPGGRGDPALQVIESGAGLTEIYHRLGWEHFSTLMMDYPGLLEELLEANNQAELRRVSSIGGAAQIPIALTYDDIAYKTSTLISPRWLRRYWIPRLQRLVEAWHNRGALCLFHSDGNLWSVLDDLVGAGIDGLNPLEVLAGMEIKEVRRRCPQLFLTGGIDVSQLLSLGSVEEVRETCRQAIFDTAGRGYFLGSTTELHWDVKLENAIAMFETAWQGADYK